jgi:tetratricopeptide (TPR) repeat protein
LIPKLSVYFSLKIDKGMPVEDAIQQSFGMSAAQFDRALRTYVSSQHYLYYAIPTPPAITSKDYSVKPLSQADSGAVIADIHLHSLDHRNQALAEFQEIIKTDPNNAAACRGLGYAYLQTQDFMLAEEYFKRAARLNSKDPRVHYYSALLLSREGSSDQGDLMEMTKELETAIALDPGFGDAYLLLAFTQARTGDSADALASM